MWHPSTVVEDLFNGSKTASDSIVGMIFSLSPIMLFIPPSLITSSSPSLSPLELLLEPSLSPLELLLGPSLSPLELLLRPSFSTGKMR